MCGVKQCYDERADDYAERYTGRRGRYFQALETEYVLSFINSPKNVLDIGTGTGRFVNALRSRFDINQAVGIDISTEMLRTAAQSTHGDFLAADGKKTPFKSDTFDTVTAVGIFEYVEDLRPYLREFRRVSTANGQVIFTAHNADPMLPVSGSDKNDYYEIARHQPEAVRRQLHDAGYRDVKITSNFYFNEYVWKLVRGLDRVSNYISDMFIDASIAVQRFLSKVEHTELGGRLLVISATIADS